MTTSIARTRIELDRIKNAWSGARIGFVPTMGALHEGHLSLVKIARQNAVKVAVSIFVNPTQFAPHEDFDSYPRQEESDLEKLRDAGVDLVYLPAEQDMYPGGDKTPPAQPGAAATGLESDFRPHFFGGVVNVVRRLFEHVAPDSAVFGEKDFQQLMVIREMVETLGLPIEIIGAPIMRDEHGLALSSRNAYLSTEELKIARRLNVILSEAKDLLNEQDPSSPSAPQDDIVIKNARQKILTAGFDKVDYFEIRWNRLLAAVRIGKTRLIDNVAL